MDSRQIDRISPPFSRRTLCCRLMVLALLILVASGCSKKIEISDDDLVLIEAKEVVELRTSSKKLALLVDPRSDARYAINHIPGALHLPLQEARSGDPRLAAVSVLVVYGSSWDDLRAVAMSKRLLALGYKDVRTYRAGLADWIRLGHDTVQAPDAPPVVAPVAPPPPAP